MQYEENEHKNTQTHLLACNITYHLKLKLESR